MKKKKRPYDDEDELPEFKRIDLSRLEEEWADQPLLYREWSAAEAAAAKKLDDAELEQEVIVADLDKSIRDSPEDYDMEKITDPAVKACIIRQLEYANAVKKVNRLRYRLMIVRGTVKACEHRKKGLEKAVDLFISDYFSSPRNPRGEGGVKFKDHQRKKARLKAGMSKEDLEDD